jgi:hypothetical protein
MRPIFHACAVILSLSAVGACGTEEEGEAPELSQLSFNPATVGVSTQTTVSGTMSFADADGDVALLGLEVVMPNGSRQTIPPSDLQSVVGMTEGQLVWAFLIAPPLAGEYTFELWVTDAEDHVSNRLSGTLVAE